MPNYHISQLCGGRNIDEFGKLIAIRHYTIINISVQTEQKRACNECSLQQSGKSCISFVLC